MWALLASLFIGMVVLLIINLPFAPLWAKLLLIPKPYLYAGITVFAVLGVYAASARRIVDLVLLVLIGLLGFVLRRYGLPLAPVLIAVILGPAGRDQPAPGAGRQRGRRQHAVRLRPDPDPLHPAAARPRLGSDQPNPQPHPGGHLTRTPEEGAVRHSS